MDPEKYILIFHSLTFLIPDCCSWTTSLCHPVSALEPANHGLKLWGKTNLSSFKFWLLGFCPSDGTLTNTLILPLILKGEGKSLPRVLELICTYFSVWYFWHAAVAFRARAVCGPSLAVICDILPGCACIQTGTTDFWKPVVRDNESATVPACQQYQENTVYFHLSSKQNKVPGGWVGRVSKNSSSPVMWGVRRRCLVNSTLSANCLLNRWVGLSHSLEEILTNEKEMDHTGWKGGLA